MNATPILLLVLLAIALGGLTVAVLTSAGPLPGVVGVGFLVAAALVAFWQRRRS